MRILYVIHGYPPYYMAGSEVYTYYLTHEIASLGNDVYVFSRIEDEFSSPYSILDEIMDGIFVRRVNKPLRDYTLRHKYIDKIIDKLYKEFLREIDPDIVHIQHLSHLSTNIINITKKYGLPIVYTLHDYWLICVRGQLITPSYKICPGPSVTRCLRCLSYMDPSYNDVVEYLNHMRRIRNNINIFLSPSRFLLEIMANHGIPRDKIIYSPYGFRKDLIQYDPKEWNKHDKIVFGFIGRIIPTKGLGVLLEAFKAIEREYDTELRIYGSIGNKLIYLKRKAGNKVRFMGGFPNWEIDSVLSEIDVLVVPSIWYENSPLVIQEAFLKGRPVVASRLGGMKELVKDGVNGLLFEPGNPRDLASKLRLILEDPTVLNSLRPSPNSVRDIRDDALFHMHLYRELLEDGV